MIPPGASSKRSSRRRRRSSSRSSVRCAQASSSRLVASGEAQRFGLDPGHRGRGYCLYECGDLTLAATAAGDARPDESEPAARAALSRARAGDRLLVAPARLPRDLPPPLRQALHAAAPVRAAVRDDHRARTRSSRSTRPRPTCCTPAKGARVLRRSSARTRAAARRGRHMEQRKLMLPPSTASDGALEGLVAEVTEREVVWGAEPDSTAPADAALTLEVILRAVFGLDEGERLDAVATRSASCWFGEKPLTLFGPPDERFERLFNRAGPLKRIRRPARPRRRADLRPRRRAPRRARGRATTCSRCCSTRAMRTARRCRTRSFATSS